VARGRKKKRIRERTQIVEGRRDLNREAEILNSEVRLDGVGEDPVIKALLLDLPTASEVEAKEIALALQKRVRGDASLLGNEEDLGEVISQIRQEAAEIDKAAEKWDMGPVKFVDDVLSQSPKLTDQQRDRLRAKGIQDYQKAIVETRAGKSYKQAQFKRMLKNAPLEKINVTGRFINTPNGMVHMPDEIRILGLSYRLSPGIQEVPAPIAVAYRRMQMERQKLQQKMSLMQGEGAPLGTHQHGDLMAKLADLEG
jgi:hypothetical protein